MKFSFSGNTMRTVIRLLNSKSFMLNQVRWSSAIKSKLEGRELWKLAEPPVKLLIELFSHHGHEIRVCGGTVRDIISDNPLKIIDLTSIVSMKCAKDILQQGKIHIVLQADLLNTLFVKVNQTTLTLQLSPELVDDQEPNDLKWEKNARRRDFTINSMFIDKDRNLYDFMNGVDDLKNNRIIFNVDPSESIRLSPIRILRYFRFFTMFAPDPNSHDKDILRVIKEHVDCLQTVHGRRLWQEFKNILKYGNPLNVPAVVKTMADLGLLQQIGFPADANIKEFQAVWNNCYELRPEPAVVLCALINNEEELKVLNKKIYFSINDDELTKMILDHRDKKSDSNPLKPYQDLFVDQQGKKLGEVKDFVDELIKYHGRSDLLISFKEWKMPKFPVTLENLFNNGITTNKMVTEVQNRLRTLWKESDFSATSEQLLQHLPKIKESLKK